MSVGLRRPRGPFVRDRSGATMVEFAIISPLLFAVIYLILNFGYFLYCSSMVDDATYFLSRDFIAQASGTTSLSWARTQFAADLNAASFPSVDPSFVLSVQPLSQVDPTQARPTSDAFNVTSKTPTVVRIVYPRHALLGIIPIGGPWAPIFDTPVDVSVVIVPQ